MNHSRTHVFSSYASLTALTWTLLASAAVQASEAPAIYTAEPLPPPPVTSATAQPPAGSKGPLRVIIPNIAQEKPAASKGDQTPGTAATPSSPSENIVQQARNVVYSSAEEIWQNGVMLVDLANTVIIRAMVKPDIAFAAIPKNWDVAAAKANMGDVALNTEALAALAPAAGGAAENIASQAQAGTPTVPNQIIPAAQPPVVTTADSSEPSPSLSSQSKAIVGNMAPTPEVKDPGAPKKVGAVDHQNSAATPVPMNTPPKVNDALGIKVNTPKAQADINYELGRAYSELMAGRSDSAIQIYEDILTGSPKNKDALFGLASTYHRLGQIDIARSVYGRLLQIDPKHRDGLNNFLVLLGDEAPQEALSQMEMLEQKNPAFSPIPAQMAIIYQKLGDKEKAVEKMYRAVAIAPENVTYRYNLAIMLDRNGNYPEAGKLYSQLLDSHAKGVTIPGDPTKIQQRLTFISSNGAK